MCKNGFNVTEMYSAMQHGMSTKLTVHVNTQQLQCDDYAVSNLLSFSSVVRFSPVCFGESITEFVSSTGFPT